MIFNDCPANTIVAAAVRDGAGKVWWLMRPCRHSHVLQAISQAYDGNRPREDREVQGFLTNDERFVDRCEAMRLAKATGQRFHCKPRYDDVLFSEDLW